MSGFVMEKPAVDPNAVREQLDRMLSSPAFRRADRSSALLKFIVEQTLNGHGDRLKEFTLGAEALGRGDAFDPRTDPVVRAEASRLRARLEQYYDTTGRADPVVVVLPKGGYVPRFEGRPPIGDEIEAPRPFRARLAQSLSSRWWIGWTVAVVAFAIAAASWVGPRSPDRTALPLQQFDIELRSDGVLATDVGNEVVLSPDGARLVFVSRTSDGRTHLNARRLDQSRVVPLAGTDGARGPFMSPDGQWVGFWAEGKLKKTAVDGGSPVVLCNATDLLGASWGDDDTIVAAFGTSGKLWRIRAEGGMPDVAIDLSADSMWVRWPQILPGSQFVLYTASGGGGADRGTIEVQSIRGGNRKILVRGGTFGRFLDSGHLAYVNQGTVYAVAFDAVALTTHGTAVPLVDNVSYSPLFGYAQLDASRTGALVYRKGAESDLSIVEWIDRSGNATPFLLQPGRYGWLRLSPDGSRLAVTATESGLSRISIYDAKTHELSGITKVPRDYTGLTWSPIGDVLLFGGGSGMGWLRPGGLDDATILTNVHTSQTPWSIAPGGGRLAYYEKNAETGFDLWSVGVTAKEDHVVLGSPEPFLRTPAYEVYPSFSPDGRWITYASNESGAWEIYVRRFPDGGSKQRISRSGGTVSRWSPNRRELLYRTDAQQIMVVTYKADAGSFIADSPRPWSRAVLADSGVLPNFDVAPDGERVLALLPATPAEDRQTANHVTLMFGFFDDVRRRVPAR
jgi:Tol biopolymer transport system component